MATKRRFMSTDELAEYVGMSRNTVYYWVLTKQIPHYKIGNKVKFDIAEVDQWLEARKVNSRDFACQTTGKPD